MTTFTITAANEDGVEATFTYDNMNSELRDAHGNRIGHDEMRLSTPRAVFRTSVDTPAVKTRAARTLKIQLGLSCNYSCEYCSQRFVPHAENGSPADVPVFMEQLQGWFDGGTDGKGAGVRVEFWGGEPFVYWKTLKPLAEAIRARYPGVTMTTITNGSLLDEEKVDWLHDMGFTIGISHDGPGQKTRGPDPLDDPKAAEGIRYALKKLVGRISINAMIHKDNPSRADVEQWFADRGLTDTCLIGEGGFIDPYDEGGLGMSAPDAKWMVDYARRAFTELRNGGVSKMTVGQKAINFVESVRTGQMAIALGQKCGMDKSQNIAIDMQGNVLSCQNVSASSVAMNGQSHKIGHVSDFDGIQLRTATHWSKRPDCKACPVLQLCQGGCMFLEGEHWERGCDNAFIDNWTFFAAGFEMLTGYIPMTVKGGRADRETPFEKMGQRRKTIPIKAA